MKKYLYLFICLLSFCFISNVKAVMYIPEFDVYVSNENGVEAEVFNPQDEVEHVTIPYNTELKLKSEQYSKNTVYTVIENRVVWMFINDLKVMRDTFTKEEGYELEEPVKYSILDINGVDMYKGPSDVFYEKLDVVIPVSTEVEYKYIDTQRNLDGNEKFVYVTYNGVDGWIYITDNVDAALVRRETEDDIAPSPVEQPKEVEEKKEEKHKPKKLEIVMVFGLAIILLLSLTSLVTLMLMNRNSSKQLDNIVKEKPVEQEEKTNNEE